MSREAPTWWEGPRAHRGAAWRVVGAPRGLLVFALVWASVGVVAFGRPGCAGPVALPVALPGRGGGVVES